MELKSDINVSLFVLSDYKMEYYDRLTAVRESGHYEEWVKFFLKAIIDSGKESLENLNVLLLVYKQII